MTETPGYPLWDVRVLDLSRVLSGPYVGRLLADLGADVLKVESPDGDTSRYWGLVSEGVSGFFLQQNAGKRCIAVDFKAPGATELLLRLVAGADIVIENFRPGVLERLGIGFDRMRAVNPQVILLSITGFGQSGPQSQRPAYAPVIHAESGYMSRQAEFDEAPVTDLMLALGDTLAGLHGTIASLAALHMRSLTNLGQHIDVAMLDSMLITDDYAHHALDGSPIKRLRSEVWNAAGGPILIAGAFVWIWRQLSKWYQLSDGLPPDTSVAEKAEARHAVVAAWISSFEDRAELVARLADAGIATGDLQDPRTVFDTEYARLRGCSVEVEVSTGVRRRVVNTPYRFSDADSGPRRGAGRIGQDNALALSDWLDMEDSAVSALVRDGVLGVDSESVTLQ